MSRYAASWVYFILAPDVDLVKIGHTHSRYPERRLHEIQGMCPVVLKRLAIMPGSWDDEQELHRKFAAYRSHGEWFRFEIEIIDFVREHGRPWPKPEPRSPRRARTALTCERCNGRFRTAESDRFCPCCVEMVLAEQRAAARRN